MKGLLAADEFRLCRLFNKILLIQHHHYQCRSESGTEPNGSERVNKFFLRPSRDFQDIFSHISVVKFEEN